MIKEDTNSVKYILEEMDPAEMIEFERNMIKNPDLRIEVESIRRMKNKLNDLPELKPPTHLTDSILSMAAAETSRKNRARNRYLLSAAVVILGITSGSFLIQNSFDDENRLESSASLSSFGNTSVQKEQPISSELKPWIDRQDVLHLSGFESGTNTGFVNNVGNSFEKLKPVGRFPNQQPFNRSLQLTGSNR